MEEPFFVDLAIINPTSADLQAGSPGNRVGQGRVIDRVDRSTNSLI